MSRPLELVAVTIRVQGTVQGVGFRPFVHRLARRLGIAGWVANDADGVSIRAEGAPGSLARFRDALGAEAPPAALIEGLTVEPTSTAGLGTFQIKASGPAARPMVRVPRDLATCAECRREVDDPRDRRRGYPFTNCTACGPRYAILEALPYDRPATSMRRFVLCAACREEYGRPSDRRFHAQPNACPACGPHVELWDRDGRITAACDDALGAAAAALRAGRIVALKGLGGFQLLVRADQSEAVALLRQRKQRPTKPLAVMVASLEAAERLGHVGPEEARLLAGPENPIVLLEAKDDSGLAPEVAPRMASIGVLLPTTPLHHLLLAAAGLPVVATSGNRGDEPIVIDERDAPRQLGGIADAFLVHDRPIVRRVDDSVVRVVAGLPVTIRLARGLAPLPLPALERMARSADGSGPPPWLAVGGHQKVAPALWTGSQAVLAQHVGDMDGAASRAAFEEVVQDLSALYGLEPAGIASDLHPDYFTTRWASERGLPLVRVQHHHAHAAAALVEHGLLDREVLALCWDGTGYGPDGTVWGGEVLRARVDRYERVASLLPFPLPGNERAIRQPRRTALGVLAMALGEEAVLGDADLLDRLGLAARDAATLLRMARRGVNTAWCSSVGRLFDAVPALLLGAGEVSHEGEAAAWLDAVAAPGVVDGYPIPLLAPGQYTGGAGDPSIPRGDWRPMIAAIREDQARGEPAGVVAARFHNALAAWAADVVSGQAPRDVVLGGGCFQNRRLAETTQRAIRDSSGARVYGPGLIPPGDGGLAAGQLAVALSQAAADRCVSRTLQA